MEKSILEPKGNENLISCLKKTGKVEIIPLPKEFLVQKRLSEDVLTSKYEDAKNFEECLTLNFKKRFIAEGASGNNKVLKKHFQTVEKVR